MRITLEVVVRQNATGRWVVYLMTATRVVDSATAATEEEAHAWLEKTHPELMGLLRDDVPTTMSNQEGSQWKC